MNYLSHAALSPNNRHILIGNLIGDHVKGRDLSGLPSPVALGVKLHRFIDRQFDAHDVIEKLRGSIESPYRRYAGIAIDLWFDHWLASNWNEIFEQPIEGFQQQTFQSITELWEFIPSTQHNFMNYLMEQKLFTGYQQANTVVRQAEMVANRLSRKDYLIECMPLIQQQLNQLNESFTRVILDMQQQTHQFIDNCNET